MLPNFIVIGAAKCGTTSVCDLLGGHPDVFMSNPKEPCFFSHMGEGHRNRDWYESLFANVGSAKAVGEGSTVYTHPDIIRETAIRISESIPRCRLIYMVRHPVKRLESDWRMRRHEQWTPDSISAAADEQRSLVSHGFYWKNLNVYREFFPDSQILIVFFEDFISDPGTELRRCFEHLGVDPAYEAGDADRPRNASAHYRADSFVARQLRGLRHFNAIVDRLPDWLVGAGRALLTSSERFDAQWQPEALRVVSQELAEDARLFLAHCGKPADYWTFPGLERTDAAT